jgi:TonB family protein
MLRRAWLLMTPLLICGCATAPLEVPIEPVAMPAMDVQPVEVTTTYIAARLPRTARGQYAIVEVCVAADGAIASSRVTQSSADQSFDAKAMMWARQARYRPQLEDGRPVHACQEVRVEINRNPGSHLSVAADSALG